MLNRLFRNYSYFTVAFIFTGLEVIWQINHYKYNG